MELSACFPECRSPLSCISLLALYVQEENTVFIMTNMIMTLNQTQGSCPEVGTISVGLIANGFGAVRNSCQRAVVGVYLGRDFEQISPRPVLGLVQFRLFIDLKDGIESMLINWQMMSTRAGCVAGPAVPGKGLSPPGSWLLPVCPPDSSHLPHLAVTRYTRTGSQLSQVPILGVPFISHITGPPLQSDSVAGPLSNHSQSCPLNPPLGLITLYQPLRVLQGSVPSPLLCRALQPKPTHKRTMRSPSAFHLPSLAASCLWQDSYT